MMQVEQSARAVPSGTFYTDTVLISYCGYNFDINNVIPQL
jgi:hypothetical protein